MLNIKITRYPDPKATGFAGCIEPEDRSWVGFVDLDGRPRLHLHRDTETGAVLPDDLSARDASLALIRAEQERRAAWIEPVSGVFYPVFAGEAFVGRTCPPALLQPADLASPANCNVDGVLLERFVPTQICR